VPKDLDLLFLAELEKVPELRFDMDGRSRQVLAAKGEREVRVVRDGRRRGR
jgi:hypothetical protein